MRDEPGLGHDSYPMLNKNVIIALTIFLMSTITTSVFPIKGQGETYMKANFAGPFFGVNLPSERESPAFIQNVTNLV
jgi:hypothetical protein